MLALTQQNPSQLYLFLQRAVVLASDKRDHITNRPDHWNARLHPHVHTRFIQAQSSQANFVANNGALRYLYRAGRPDWKKLFRSFGAQSVAAAGPLKTKILACANKAIYADIERALIEVNNPHLSPDFSSENFE